MPKKTQKQVFWFSFFLVLLLFFAAALFMVAEYNTVRSGYTPQPPLYRFVRQIMEPVSRAVRPVLQWFHLVRSPRAGGKLLIFHPNPFWAQQKEDGF